MTARPLAVRHAFTLIELLVVVSLVALLIGILLPTLSGARESAKSINCLSNLRQMSTAVASFAHDHDGRAPTEDNDAETIVVGGDTYIVHWFGANLSATSGFLATEGRLYDYWGTADVGGCPTTDNEDREGYGPVDYAYNVVYLGNREPTSTGSPTLLPGARIDAFRSHSTTVVFLDSARLASPLGRTPWGYPPSGFDLFGSGPIHAPVFHGRHEGRGNVAWLDGHADSREPTVYPSYNSLITPDQLRDNKLGDIDPNDDGVRQDDLWDPR